jgi:diguanylate cyclase
LKLPQSYIAGIPNEYKREFINKVCRENFLRMLVIAVLLVVIESLIAIFEAPESTPFYIALYIALLSLLFIPILDYSKKNIKQMSKFWIMFLQSAYLCGILAGGIAWSLQEQSTLAAGSTYFLAIFTIAAFIVMPPIISAVLFLASNIVFMLLLPGFQLQLEVIATLNVNTITATAAAWIMNQMASRKEVASFINEKIIIEKNIELEKKNVELNELTMRDSMTNLLNHKNSMRRLKEEVDRAKRINYPLSVAMIDLDNFKLVNDTYGHQTGDEVLIRVAQILAESCRTTDVVGRYGGEEFIIIMPDTNDRDAALLLSRIQTLIEETCFKDGIHITLSCGISEFHGESVHGFLKSSDVMLYEAKKKGKNRVEVQMKEDMKSAVIN